MFSTLSHNLLRVVLGAYFVISCCHLRAEFLADQSFQPVVFDATYSLFDEQDISQIFTVGVTGDLGIVDVYVSNFDSEPILFDVRPTVAGLPQANDSPVLIERSGVPNVITGEWFRFDFSSEPVPVAEGDVLAIVLRSPTGNAVWNGGVFGGYDGGKGVGRNPTQSLVWAEPGKSDLGDLGFRTYVRPVPEPACGVMLAITAISWMAGSRHHLWSYGI